MSQLPPDPYDDDPERPPGESFEAFVAWVLLAGFIAFIAAITWAAFHAVRGLFQP